MNTCPTCPNDLVCHDLGECLARNKPEPAPDYGEPWRVMPYADGGVGTREARPIIEALRLSLRAVECVNSLAGVPDPAAHLAALREAIKTLVDLCERAMTVIQSDYPDTADMDDFVTDFDCTRQEIQPFLDQ
jgi:hypothetical protein